MSWGNAGNQDGYPTLVFARETAVALAEEETLWAKPGIDTARASLSLTQSQAQVPVLGLSMPRVTLDKSFPSPSVCCVQFIKWR